MRLHRSIRFMTTLLLVAAPASAALNFGTPAWSRPATPAQATAWLSTYQHWDVFTSPTGTTPDVGLVNPNGTPNAFDANYPASGTIVTSTGNLYAGSGIIRMNVVVPNFGAHAERTRILLQIKTIGTALFDTDGFWPKPPVETDFSRLFVNRVRVDSIPSFTYSRLNLAPGSGPTSFDVERAIAFDIPGSASSYTLEWSTARGSCSQMEIAVDTHVVLPEPIAAMGMIGCGLLSRRRRTGT
jgi:hypothetical protein